MQLFAGVIGLRAQLIDTLFPTPRHEAVPLVSPRKINLENLENPAARISFLQRTGGANEHAYSVFLTTACQDS
jgi:hypothetical protein